MAELREVLLLAVVALLPIERDLTIWSEPGGANDHHLRIGLSAFHLPLTALVVLSVGQLVVRRMRPELTWRSKLVLATVAWLAVCVALSPGWRGLDLLFHLLAAWAVWDTVSRADGDARTRLLVAVVALGAMQAILGIAQEINRGPLGISILEARAPLDKFDSVVAVRGSLTHQYHYAGLILVCSAAAFVVATRRRLEPTPRRLLLTSLAVMGVAIPMTLSRTALLSVAPMLAILVLFERRALLRQSIAWLAGMVAGTLSVIDGIFGRSVESFSAATGGSSASFDTGRIDRLRDAVDLVERHPIVGVGPGNYTIELRELRGLVGDQSAEVLPSHNVVFHAAAEAGLIGGALVLACLVALVAWTWRAGHMRALVVISLLPFFVLDLYPYMLQLGIVVSALWISVAHVAGDVEHDRPPSTPRRTPRTEGAR